MYRSRKLHRANLKATKTDACAFCHLNDATINPVKRRIIRQTEHAVVVDNIFPYRIWEMHNVVEHFMVLPKRHVTSMDQLTLAERLDIMDLFCTFEAIGYSVYLRAPQNARRTVSHIHAHLIKIDAQKPKVGLYLKRPYVHIKI